MAKTSSDCLKKGKSGVNSFCKWTPGTTSESTSTSPGICINGHFDFNKGDIKFYRYESDNDNHPGETGYECGIKK